MKILFLTERSDNNVGVFNYHGFEVAIGELAECKWAGLGWPLHRAEEPIDATVKRVMPDAEWVMCPRETLVDVTRSKFNTGIMITDLHGKHNWGLKSPDTFAEALGGAGYDVIFSRYQEVHGLGCDPQLFQWILGDRFKWLPWSMDEDYYFRFKGKPEYDVLFSGSQHPRVYPLRHAMFRGLPNLCQRNDLRLFLREGVGVPVWKAKIDKLEKQGYPVGSNYARLLGTSRTALFGNSQFRYPLQKNFEVRASGCLAVSDAPVGAEELGFEADVDYVNVSPESWKRELMYYLENWDEGMEVAEAGRQLFLEKHTHRVRAREFVDFLQRR